MSSPEMTHELAPSQNILQMLTGKWITQGVSVAATLGIADLLKEGPRSVEELAKATSTHADSLYRLLRSLASIGIFAETEHNRFTLTPLAQCLRSDAPDSMRSAARMWGLPLFGLTSTSRSTKSCLPKRGTCPYWVRELLKA